MSSFLTSTSSNTGVITGVLAAESTLLLSSEIPADCSVFVVKSSSILSSSSLSSLRGGDELSTISGPLAAAILVDVAVDALVAFGVIIFVDVFGIVDAVLGVVVVFVAVLVGLFSSWDEGGEIISCVHSSVFLLSLEVVGAGGGGAGDVAAAVILGMTVVTSGDVAGGTGVDLFFFGLPVQ